MGGASPTDDTTHLLWCCFGPELRLRLVGWNLLNEPFGWGASPSSLIARKVRCRVYMIGRLLVDYQYDGFIFFPSVVAGFSESIFVPTICWTSLKHVSVWFDRGWWNKLCLHLVTWIWLWLQCRSFLLLWYLLSDNHWVSIIFCTLSKEQRRRILVGSDQGRWAQYETAISVSL